MLYITKWLLWPVFPQVLGTWIPCFMLLSGAGVIEAETSPPELPGEPQDQEVSF